MSTEEEEEGMRSCPKFGDRRGKYKEECGGEIRGDGGEDGDCDGREGGRGDGNQRWGP